MNDNDILKTFSLPDADSPISDILPNIDGEPIDAPDMNKEVELYPQNDDNNEITTSLENYNGTAHGNFVINDNKTSVKYSNTKDNLTKYGLEKSNLIPDNLPHSLEYNQGCKNSNPNESKCFVSTVNEVEFSIYLTGDSCISSPLFQTNFVCCVESIKRVPNFQTLNIYLGSLYGGSNPSPALGSIISVISNMPKESVITKALSRCSFAETCIWMFGHKRILSTYGALQFSGIKQFLKDNPMFQDYFCMIFDKAIELNLITEEDKKMLFETSSTIFITVNSDGSFNKNIIN